jgi:hypothetical protein
MDYLIKPRTVPFWSPEKKSGVSTNSYLMLQFLKHYGFSSFQTVSDRTSSKTLILNEDGVLKVFDETNLKRWVQQWLESIDEKEFLKDGLLDTTTDQFPSASKYDVLSFWVGTGASKWKSSVLETLPVYSDEGYSGSEKINLFTDSGDTCHVPFRNGVVRITKDQISLIDFDEVKSQGAIWESSIINRDIKLDPDGNKGLFEEFCERSMYRKDVTLSGEDWMDEYRFDDFSEGQYRSMRTAYGYLIHTFNNQDLSKAIYFIDADSDLGRPQGGNGKSVIMRSIEHWKKTVKQDGKRFKGSVDGGGRFQFSNVTVDTKLIVIDDIRPEFSFEDLFSLITGDMEVEGKGTNKFVIPADKKPKLGLTTNYVIPGTGTSYKRRQHIVEFGNYWNRCNEEGESPGDVKHLGKMMFDRDFDQSDWNDFYNYGFRCVQEYLRDGLVQSDVSAYELKTIKATVEGSEGSGAFTAWFDDWVRVDRLKGGFNSGDGISLDDLWSSFRRNYPLEIDEEGGSWDKKRFDNAIWEFTSQTKGYAYNGHLSHKGDNKSSRRWQRGPAGEQTPHIRITTDFDPEWLKEMETQTNDQEIANDDEEDFSSYFDKLAS